MTTPARLVLERGTSGSIDYERNVASRDDRGIVTLFGSPVDLAALLAVGWRVTEPAPPAPPWAAEPGAFAADMTHKDVWRTTDGVTWKCLTNPVLPAGTWAQLLAYAKTVRQLVLGETVQG